ncbi:MAG TPA: hypothetical protein VJT49_14855 [Amycolatopsis sp.]|uniref:hypothetical protein n=1 Tax=Amycolatopsis sp. TaxID=37632 RepID=UPI002B463311|nr:hypothetical protein [Amycolatopsis sp.]HKS46358.1 hypothetical protein [Amycolatopsis sp.]
MINDGIADLITGGPGGNGNGDVGYHIGVVTAWDDATAANTVLVNGQSFGDLRVITAGPAIGIAAGDTVVLLRAQTQYFILGKVAATGASAAMRSKSDFVSPQEGTSSTTFTDLTTVGPTVPTYIGSSGSALVMTSTTVVCPVNVTARMSFAISGATTQTAAAYRGCRFYSGEAGAFISLSNAVQVIGLNQGSTTFTAKYLSDGGSTDFVNRSLIVIPF